MEGKVGLVHQGPEQVGRQRQRLREAVYVTTFQGFERLGEELYVEADRQGLERAGLVIFLRDGAKGLREIQQTHFHDARFVLDWFHLRQEVYRALPMAGPELDPDYILDKYVLFKDLLWVGEVDLVLERLDRLRAGARLAMPSPASRAISKTTARALAMPSYPSRASRLAPARLKGPLTSLSTAAGNSVAWPGIAKPLMASAISERYGSMVSSVGTPSGILNAILCPAISSQWNYIKRIVKRH